MATTEADDLAAKLEDYVLQLRQVVKLYFELHILVMVQMFLIFRVLIYFYCLDRLKLHWILIPLTWSC